MRSQASGQDQSDPQQWWEPILQKGWSWWKVTFGILGLDYDDYVIALAPDQESAGEWGRKALAPEMDVAEDDLELLHVGEAHSWDHEYLTPSRVEWVWI